MSWARTTVSTRMESPSERRRADHRTATPVTNIASVESMNGAPRMAPTPTALAEAPDANRIAMIGIIVSGSAVPTAARTEPTAPSASWSFRPNHSMPFVNSSAPIRITTKATARMPISSLDRHRQGSADTDRDDQQDPDRHGDHQPIIGAAVVDAATRSTRPIGAAMTASRPIHRNPAGSRAQVAATTVVEIERRARRRAARCRSRASGRGRSPAARPTGTSRRSAGGRRPAPR